MNTPTTIHSSAAGAPVIDVERVAKSVTGPQGELQILDDINFAIDARQRVAITGVSGSGKSTLLGLMAGLDTVSSGRIVVLGHDLAALDEDARAELRRDHVGFVFQAFHLVQSFTALENVMLPLELKGGGDARGVAGDLLGRVGLGARMDHFPRQLSGGEQQRVALARAFCTSPALLFADEPTGNLDARTAESVVELLFALNDEFGTTLVIVTHDDRLASACDRRIALDGGRIVAST
ncbi:MAG: ABC transporter ATP-binding protein [Gammaproteobacteria bacterium]